MRRAIRTLGRAVFWLVVALCLSPTLVPPFLDRIYYEGPRTGHYDGERFFNPDGDDTSAPPGGGPSTSSGRRGFLLSRLLGPGERGPWPERVAVTPGRPPARVAEPGRMVATWVGHATVLVQANGLNILTDPIWSERASPFGFVGPRRVAAPGVRFEDLPRIDLVLVSHNHYDHMDLPTLRRLWERDRPLVVTSLGNDAVIRQAGVPARALDWGARVPVRPGVAVTVNRNHHWGSRWFADRNRALWSSFVVSLPGGNLFFAGDTGFGDGRWPAEAAALGPVRLALIPIGAFRFAPGQLHTGSHIGPLQAAEVFKRLGAGRGIAIHHGTFRLSDEAYDTPPRMLRAAMGCRGYSGPQPFSAVTIGRPVAVPAYTAPQPATRDPAALARCLQDLAIADLR